MTNSEPEALRGQNRVCGTLSLLMPVRVSDVLFFSWLGEHVPQVLWNVSLLKDESW